MIVGSGQISFNDIVQEFGFAPATTMDLRLRLNGTKKQVWIANNWQDLNMCSSSLPSHTPPHNIIDWYNYNHAAPGVGIVDISGTFSVITGQSYIYTTTFSGVGNSETYSYSIVGGTITSQTGNQVTVTWNDLNGATLTATVSNVCSSNSKTVTVSSACVAPSNIVVSGATEISNGQNVTYSAAFSGSNINTTFTWSISGYGTIVSGQGTSQITVQWAFNDANVSQSANITCVVGNACGSAQGAIAVTPYTYWNDERSGTATRNNCGANYTGSTVAYTVPANTYKAYSKYDANNLAQSDVDNNKQNYANANGTCTLNCTAPSNVVVGNFPTINNGQYVYYDVSYGGSDINTTFAWSVSGYGTIVSGQGTNQILIQWAFNDAYAAQSAVVSCVVSNACGSASGSQTVTPETHWNDERSGAATRNNCGANQTGSTVTYTVPANTYKAYSKNDANNLAQSDVDNNKQNYANANGTCTLNCATITLVSYTLDSVYFNGVVTGSVTVNSDLAGGNIQAILSYAGESQTFSNLPVGQSTHNFSITADISTGLGARTMRFVAFGGCSSEVLATDIPITLLDFGRVVTSLAHNPSSGQKSLLIDNNGGAELRLRYCFGNSFVCSYSPPNADYVTAHQNGQYVNGWGTAATGQQFTVRIWFVNHPNNYIDRVLTFP